MGLKIVLAFLGKLLLRLNLFKADLIELLELILPFLFLNSLLFFLLIIKFKFLVINFLKARINFQYLFNYY